MSTRKTILCLTSVLFFLQPAQAAPQPPLPMSSYLPELGPNASLVSELPNRAAIVLSGLLTPQSAVTVRRFLDQKNSIRALYIDSRGGDLTAAMALGDLVRQRMLHLVVIGRCLSACANYVFTAAHSKEVMPGALVGIHGKSVNAYVGDKTITVQARHADKLVAATRDPLLSTKISAIGKSEHAFYAKLGISTRYHDAFERYGMRREARSTSAPGACPAIDFWVLRRKDLENMGVTGIGAMWEPANQAMASKAAAQLRLGSSNKVFFGDAAALEAQCKPATGFMARLRSLFK